jgi:predicted CXXCH cytochrome family protein
MVQGRVLGRWRTGAWAAAAIVVLALAVTQCGGGGGGGGGGNDGGGGPFPDGFLGLTNVAQNVTQCGECHPSQQSHWVETAHADAFDTLDAIGQSGADQPCALCHNVTSNGNALTDPDAGFIGTPVAELHNVQCESCHGPGAEHVDDVTQHPDASLGVSLTEGCGECHQAEHHPFVEEWMESAHAHSLEAGQAFGENVAANPDCAYCHVAQSFIRFIQSGGTELIITSNPEPITCVACHDPHGNGNDKQIRVLPGEPIVCGQCHNQGPAMVGNAPHHPQRDVLLGNAGFEFPGESYPGASTHGDTDFNPDLCITCHVVTTPFVGGDFPIAAQVGHTFTPIPVIDEATGERNFTNCVECHANPESVFNNFRAEIDPLVAELRADLDGVPEDQRGSESYQGALFNLQTYDQDKSRGVHNPNRTRRLIETSIEKLGEL